MKKYDAMSRIRRVSTRRTRAALARGFTLLEVLVVIGVTSLLFALILPAVQHAREASRRQQCASRLHDLGLALNQHVAATGAFPYIACAVPEAYGFARRLEAPRAQFVSAFVSLLPHLDRAELFHAYNLEVPIRGEPVNDHVAPHPANRTVGNQRIGSFICPSDVVDFTETGTGINFRVNTGPTAFYWSGELGIMIPTFHTGKGAFRSNHRHRPGEFPDGLAQTIMVSEKPKGLAEAPFNRFVGYIATAQPFESPDQLAALCAKAVALDVPDVPAANYFNQVGCYWSVPSHRFTSYSHDTTPNSAIVDCVGNAGMAESGMYGSFAARSYHPGGVNVLFADGHVQFISDQVVLPVWRALGTRSGEEAISGEY